MDALFLVQIFLKILMRYVNISKQVVTLRIANVFILRGFLLFFILFATLLRIKLSRTPQRVSLISCPYWFNSNVGRILISTEFIINKLIVLFMKTRYICGDTACRPTIVYFQLFPHIVNLTIVIVNGCMFLVVKIVQPVCFELRELRPRS
jgi:hypothetical protein